MTEHAQATTRQNQNAAELWPQLAAQLRIDSIRCTTAASSGHPTSSMSAADVMSVLLTSYLRYDFSQPDHPNNDSLIFSKGHACPLLYAAYKAAGAISDEELLSLRQFGSIFEGHPTPDIPWVEAATGSLGQGLSVGVGDALAGKYLDQLPFRVWVILGDSEMAEGSVWEGFHIASHYGLNNMVAIIDVNRLGQRGETELGWHTDVYAERAHAFGWNPIVIDGHNFEEINNAFQQATSSNKPTCIVARTEKGHGARLTANVDGWHGKALSAEQATTAIAELGGQHDLTIEVNKPEDRQPAANGSGPNASDAAKASDAAGGKGDGKADGGKAGDGDTPGAAAQNSAPSDGGLPQYKLGEKVATRQAYGDALKAVGAADHSVVVLDAEVSNSTFAEVFGKAYPERFFEMFIAEQQMVSAAVGLQHRGKKPYCSTFSAFFTRAFDQIRMGVISQADIKLCGSHAGISIGEDGPSQMALEDLAMFRAVHGSTVLYPSDGPSTAALVQAMKDQKGIVFMRSTREKTPVLYDSNEQFPIGGSKTLRQSDNDVATIIGAGITLHEAIKAAEQLQGENIAVRVIDLYSVKPVDAETLQRAARETNHLIVVEDHWQQGGLGDAVLSALAGSGEAPRWTHLAVFEMPRSGKPAELLDAYGISAKHIVEAVKSAQ